MNEDTNVPLESQEFAGHARHELERLKKEWKWFVALGACLIALGVIAVGSTYYVGLATVVLFGVLLLIGGVAQVISAFWAGRWSGFLLHLLIGVFYVVVGMLIVDAPADALATLTLLVAAFLMVSGIFRIAGALNLRFNNWGWILMNGIITLMLGILIYRQWPASAEIAIGLFVGIEMIFNGITWTALGMGLKRLDEEDASQAE
jgi:uncharacterized membrane protein HdeD (DUF308 family)